MNRHIINIITSTIILLTLTNCSVFIKFYGKAVTQTDKSLIRASRLTKDDKEIILVPMCHIGTPEHYNRVKIYLDSLKSNGFVTFFECIVISPLNIDSTQYITGDIFNSKLFAGKHVSKGDSLRFDTLRRKYRYITGSGAGAYTYKEAPKNIVRNKFRKEHLIDQTLENIGLTTRYDIWTDFTLIDLVDYYERKFGTIQLSEYDFTTPLDSLYNMPLDSTRNTYYLLNSIRESRVRRLINESSHRKIAIVYGESHIRFLKLHLRYLEGYTLDKKYKIPKEQR